MVALHAQYRKCEGKDFFCFYCYYCHQVSVGKSYIVLVVYVNFKCESDCGDVRITSIFKFCTYLFNP